MDLPPDPNEPGWDDWVEEQLDGSGFDIQLGREMAEDALSIAKGGLSKAEFHERYTEAVQSEFGIDERPTRRSAGRESDESEPLPKVPDTDGRSRRRVLKALGGLSIAGTTGLAGCIGTDASLEDTLGGESEIRDDIDGEVTDEGIIDEIPHRKQLGMVVDTERCVACLQCSLACKEENDTDIGVHWPYVFRYEDEHAGGTREGYLTRHCQHCSEPTCTYVCPTQARYKRTEDGVVLTDYDLCIGCRYCQVACPYGVNYLGSDEPNEEISDGFDGDRIGRDGKPVGGPPPAGVMGKCTFCVHRQDADDPELRGTTACEQACPFGVIHFGDMNNPHSDPRRYLQEKGEANQFKLLEEKGNDPNIVFIGMEPSKNADPIQGPVAYEDHGMQDGDYDYIDELAGGESE